MKMGRTSLEEDSIKEDDESEDGLDCLPGKRCVREECKVLLLPLVLVLLVPTLSAVGEKAFDPHETDEMANKIINDAANRDIMTLFYVGNEVGDGCVVCWTYKTYEL
jgi:adenosyl cobinamide kinase/adenosyl cobinamide phosphate guanylyltransferase